MVRKRKRGSRAIADTGANNGLFAISSFKTAAALGRGRPLAIGERINPAGKPHLAEALSRRNPEPLLWSAKRQIQAGAAALDVNVTLANGEEPGRMRWAVETLSALNVPLVLDSRDPATLEAGLRACVGSPLLNSARAEGKNLREVFSLAKSYGACVVGLCMEGRRRIGGKANRLACAQRILGEAQRQHFSEEEILFDPIALPEIYFPSSRKIFFQTLRALKQMGLRTITGISNISFGVTNREETNAGFLKEARRCGLDAAILDPLQKQVMQAACRIGREKWQRQR